MLTLIVIGVNALALTWLLRGTVVAMRKVAAVQKESASHASRWHEGHKVLATLSAAYYRGSVLEDAQDGQACEYSRYLLPHYWRSIQVSLGGGAR